MKPTFEQIWQKLTEEERAVIWKHIQRNIDEVTRDTRSQTIYEIRDLINKEYGL